MAITIRFDSSNNPMPARLILTTRSGNRIRELPINEVKFREGLTDGSEFSFKVYKERCINSSGEIDDSFWKKITDFKLVYCPEFDMWYELAVDVNESDSVVKSVQATSLGEAELEQVKLYGLEINTEEDINREDYVPTVFYNENTTANSLVDRLLYKAPHYRIAHVDESLKQIQRSFEFDNVSAYEAFQTVAKEVDCLFRFECVKGEDSKIDRKISAYDLENNCMACGERGDFIGVCPKCGSTAIKPGYGADTSIYISRDNLADSVTFTTDTGSVKNCYRLEAGDDLMTATIINCNPNGSQYIWYINDDTKEDMSEELRNKINDYNEMYDAVQSTSSWTPNSDLLTQYNTIAQRYKVFDNSIELLSSPIVGYPALMNAYYNTIDLQLFLNNELMPSVTISSTTAALEAEKLTSASLTPVAVANISSCTAATAESAVLGMAKCLIRDTYQLKVRDSVYSTATRMWTGTFTVTSYGDETDTAVTNSITVAVNEDMETYIMQKLRRAMKKEDHGVTDISELFALDIASLEDELKKYALQRLISFRDSCQACLDILIQQGVAERDVWTNRDRDLYTTMYLPYLEKMAAIEAEIQIRTEELAIVTGVYDDQGGILFSGMQSEIIARRNGIQEMQDFENYLGTDLWNEFAAYRREDTYSNPNYISDGLSNEELFERALQFLDVAEKEIYIAATTQHSMTAEVHNLLSMREFRPLVNMFKVGNWIRVAVDKDVYRLRLSDYTITYDDWKMDVEFTDVKYGHNSASDIASLLDKARSMTASYGKVARQAKDGKESHSIMKNWVAEGFSLTTKLVGGAENQEIVIDNSVLTGREFLPETGEYSDKQVKVTSGGLYVTNDGWLTAKAGVGSFQFFNPTTGQTEEAFGVIADTLVGNILLAQNIGIYNENGSVGLDEDGFTLITEAGDGGKTFRILRREPNGTLTNILAVDSSGHLVIEAGSIDSAVTSAVELDSRGIVTKVENRMSEISTAVQQRTDGLEIQVAQNTGDIGVQKTTFRVTADGAEISKNTSDTALKLENEQITFELFGEPVTWWNINEQVMPKMVNIPLGGSLRLGQLQFQPRSSGNLSLLWVGS